MVSSTIKDLLADRDAAMGSFDMDKITEVVGAVPVRTAYVGNPFNVTTTLAAECDFFVLLLGHRYGYEAAPGKSATEVEFDAAYASDPTKIVIFRKDGSTKTEKRQQAFIDRVSEYKTGFWVTRYRYTHELQRLLQDVFLDWLRERAAIGDADIMSRFLKIAMGKMPFPDTKVEYAVTDSFLELKIHQKPNVHTVHFDKSRIYKDFYGCLYELSQIIDDIRGL